MPTEDPTKIPQISNTILHQPEDLTSFNKWIFETIHPYLFGRTLELGSGHGLISRCFLEKEIRVHLSDPSKPNRDILRENFKGAPTLRFIHNIDFSRPDFMNYYSSALNSFNTLVALNVIENGYFSSKVLQNAKSLIVEKGCFIMLMPAYFALYDGFEEELENLKKYNYKPLEKLWGKDFKILKTRYIKLKNIFQSLSNKSLGLSVLVIAQKTNTNQNSQANY